MIPLILSILMCVSGCVNSKPMNNDEIIAEVQKIEKAGLESILLYNGFSEVIRVQARPKKDSK